MRLSLILLLAAGSVLAEHGLQREGAFWVQTSSGAVSIPQGGKVRVIAQGPVVIRGGGDPQAAFTLRKRVKARDEQEAQALLRQTAIRIRRHGEQTHFVVSRILPGQPSPELELKLPPRVSHNQVETRGGNVECYDLTGSVHVETGGGLVRMARIGGTVTAVSGGGEIHLGAVRGSVRSVSGGGMLRFGSIGGEVRIESGGGEISIWEAGGPIHASTAGGNIRVRSAAASVYAHTSGGLIEIRKAVGIVDAWTSGGKILVGAAQGVNCETGAGGIQLRGVTGAVRANTVSGSILAELAGRLSDSLFTTVGGDVTLFLPSNLAVTVKAQTESAGSKPRIISEFPEVRVRPTDVTLQVAEGAINGGGPLLRITSSGGGIYLKRSD